MIFKVETYTDGSNVIQSKTRVGRSPFEMPNLSPAKPQFFAAGWMKFAVGGGETQVNFQFDIPGDTPEEAFTNFPEAFAAAKVRTEETFKQQLAQQQVAEASKIIIPGAPAGRMNGMGRG